MSKFKNSNFHREGRPKQKPVLKSKPTAAAVGAEGAAKAAEAPQTEFIRELVDTGKANWKKAPAAVRKRYNGIFLILVSIPILFMTTSEMVRRLEGKSTKKVQQGEILENREIRKFDEQEKWQVERNSLTYKIFGRDFFLDGFTSKTMKPESAEAANGSTQK